MENSDYDYDDDTINEHSVAITSSAFSTKKHIIRLRNFGFDKDIIQWIENEIVNLTIRFHKFDDIILSAYVILAHQANNVPYDIDNILSIMNTSKSKKKIHDIISGNYTRKCPVNCASINIPCIYSSPTDYVKPILLIFFQKYNIIVESFEDLVIDICYFMDAFFYANPRFSNFYSRSTACVFIFFFLTTFYSNVLDKTSIKKSHFKDMKFGNSSSSNNINPKTFDLCLLIIEEMYNVFLRTATEFELKKLISVTSTLK